MKKTLLAATLAAALSPAFAQTNVNMYGIVDAGVSFDRTGNAGAGTAFRANSGYLSSSRLGFTGTEDLGGGLKGVFTLELGFDADTGAFKTSGPGAGFGRRSFVGVQSGFGTLTIGRDYTPLYWTLLAGDNQSLGLYGNLLNVAALVPANNGNDAVVRASNALFYTSPNFGGLTVRGLVSAGAQQGGENFVSPRAAGRMYGIGGDYVAGPLTVTAAYQQLELQTGTTSATDERKDAAVGAKYNFGAFSVGAGYAQVDNVGPNNTNQLYWLGGTAKLGAGTVLAQFSQIRQDVASGTEPRANTYSIGYTYPLSRRTTAYASYGQVSNNSASGVGLYASDNSITGVNAGKDPRGFAVGVRHAF